MSIRIRPVIRSARQSLRLLGALAIGCQFLVPTGYMPGSFAHGTPFVLCDMLTSVPAQHAASDAATAHDMQPMHAEAPDSTAHSPGNAEHDEHLGADAWEHCPLGKLSAAAALAFTVTPFIAPATTDLISTTVTAQLHSVAVLTARARAPPLPAPNSFA